MNLEDIVELKKDLLQKYIEPTREKLFKNIDNDKNFTLSTDEITELVDDMIIEYLKPSKD